MTLRSVCNFLPYLFILLLKLIFVSDFDMPAFGGGHDDFWFVLRAADWYWFGKNYDQMLLIKEPLWPLTMAALSYIGIPLRTNLEIIFWLGTIIFACLALPQELKHFKLKRLLCVAFLLFTPEALPVFERTTADALFCVIFLISFGIILYAIRHADKLKTLLILSGIYGSILGLLVCARSEGPLIILAGVTAFIAVAFFTQNNWKKKIGAIVTTTVSILICCSIIQMPFKMANYWRFGFWGLSELSENNFLKAITNLAQIKPTEEPYSLPLTMATATRAAEFSPTLKQMTAHYVGDVGQFWTRISLGVPHKEGEVGSGWFHWAIRDSVAASGFYKTPQQAREYYQKLNSELEEAFNSGKLERRKIFHFLIPTIPGFSSLLNSAGRIFIKCVYSSQFDPVGEFFSPSVQNYYDSIAKRKNLFLEKQFGLFSFQGILFERAHPQPLTEIFFIGNGLTISGNVIQANDPAIPSGNGAVGYSIVLPGNAEGIVYFKFYDGKLLTLNKSAVNLSSNIPDEVFLTSKVEPAAQLKLGQFIVDHFKIYHISWTIVLGIFYICAIIWAIVGGLKKSSFLAATCAFLALYFIRFNFMMLMDSSAFHMTDWRYIFPLTLLTAAFPFAILGISKAKAL